MAHSSSPNFDIGSLIQQSWQIVQKNALVLILGLLIVVLISGAANGLVYMITGYNGIGQLIVGGPLMLGYFACVLRAARGGTADFPELFSGFQRFLPAFLANLIIGILSSIGFVLCILPGLFVGMIYSLTYFYMHDKKLDFWPSMEASRQTVMSAIGAWIPLYLVVIALVVAGIILCGVGALITVPISAVMLALAYDQVSGGGTSYAEPIRDEYAA
ncbi:MAG TPA: hypothetical protein PLJ47_04410 [Candidatus Hydrogenedentes bacterium]|nr:hypothetical protein [Candidatus Hydrogenedentota bacterium]